MKLNQKMKTSMSLAAAMGTLALTVNSAHAAITVTGGDFESPNIGTLAQINTIPNWFSNTIQYTDWHNSSGYTDNGTQSAVLNNVGGSAGYMYQSLGTLDAGTTSLDWSFDHVGYVINGNLRGAGPGEVRFFYGTDAGAGDGADIDTLVGLTQIGSAASIPTYPGSNTLRSGSVDVSSLSAGETIWMDFTQTGGNEATFDIDNVAVTANVPEPTTTALLGLGGLALIFRRCK